MKEAYIKYLEDSIRLNSSYIQHSKNVLENLEAELLCLKSREAEQEEECKDSDIEEEAFGTCAKCNRGILYRKRPPLDLGSYVPYFYYECNFCGSEMKLPYDELASYIYLIPEKQKCCCGLGIFRLDTSTLLTSLPARIKGKCSTCNRINFFTEDECKDFLSHNEIESLLRLKLNELRKYKNDVQNALKDERIKFTDYSNDIDNIRGMIDKLKRVFYSLNISSKSGQRSEE